MDLNALLRRHQLSLIIADRSLTPREKRAHDQFAREYADQIGIVRDALGAPPPPRNRDVNPPEHAGPPNARGPKIMAFRKRSGPPLPTPEQSRRQGDVVRSAWRHFGEPGPVIAFLDTTHESLNGQPLHLAIRAILAWSECKRGSSKTHGKLSWTVQCEGNSSGRPVSNAAIDWTRKLTTATSGSPSKTMRSTRPSGKASAGTAPELAGSLRRVAMEDSGKSKARTSLRFAPRPKRLTPSARRTR